MTEDNDIKIFGQEDRDQEGGEVQALAQEMKYQRLNGNTDRARTLGCYLAELKPYRSAATQDAGMKKYMEDPEILYQIQVLTVFTAESALRTFVPTALLADTAIQSLYDHILKEASDFYNNISDGTAFSFYYLSVRRGGEVAQSVGAAFAMLCEREKDAALEQLGVKIYINLCAFIKQKVEEAGFVD